jgi:hypothetical protein
MGAAGARNRIRDGIDPECAQLFKSRRLAEPIEPLRFEICLSYGYWFSLNQYPGTT